MKPILNHIMLAVAASLLSACVAAPASKSPEEAPDWVKLPPADAAYYVGIGTAPVTADPQAYRQTAKRLALEDLASEITVDLRSTQTLYTRETNETFRERYEGAVVTSTDLEGLKGYELAGTWEDGNTYYVYYRLSKTAYARLLREREEAALAKREAILSRASRLLQEGNLVQASREMEVSSSGMDKRELALLKARWLELTAGVRFEVKEPLLTVSIMDVKRANWKAKAILMEENSASVPLQGLPVMLRGANGPVWQGQSGPDGSIDIPVPYEGQFILQSHLTPASGFGLEMKKSLQAAYKPLAIWIDEAPADLRQYLRKGLAQGTLQEASSRQESDMQLQLTQTGRSEEGLEGFHIRYITLKLQWLKSDGTPFAIHTLQEVKGLHTSPEEASRRAWKAAADELNKYFRSRKWETIND